jgi:hypothetical protein
MERIGIGKKGYCRNGRRKSFKTISKLGIKGADRGEIQHQVKRGCLIAIFIGIQGVSRKILYMVFEPCQHSVICPHSHRPPLLYRAFSVPPTVFNRLNPPQSVPLPLTRQARFVVKFSHPRLFALDLWGGFRALL